MWTIKMIHNQKFNLAFLLFVAITISTNVAADDCCTPGEKKPDPNDCTKYFVCCTGQFKPINCPPGHYFNVQQNNCTIDNGECNCNGTTCVDGETKADVNNCANFLLCVKGEYQVMTCPGGTYWNAKNKTCEWDNGQCNVTPTPPTCVEGSVSANPLDCTKYYKCVNGKYEAQSCKSGYYWNVHNKTCEVNNGHCNVTPTPPTCVEGAVSENPLDCTGYYKCVNGKYEAQFCKSGLYWDKNNKTCKVNNGECNVTPTPPTCVEGTVSANPLDCTGFYKCINGKYVAQTCNPGFYWNAKNMTCERDNGECKVTPTPPTCVEGAVSANPLDCTKYFKCVNGKYEAQACEPGYYWNVPGKKCAKNNGECNVTPTPPTCVEGAVSENPLDCTGYYKCVNGKYEAQFCKSGLYWDKNNKTCEVDNGVCKVTPTPPTCTEGNKTANPENCAGYFECINNVNVKRQCPATTYFDEKISMCVIDSTGVCIPKVCDPECCDKPNDWLGPVDKNCSAFIQCLYGHKFEQKCPNNLHFNNATLSCDYPENVQCDDGSAPPSGPTAGPSGTYCASKGRCVNKPDGQKLNDANNVCSSSFVVCQCECEIEMKCSAGLIFDVKLETCNWPANVNC